MRSGRGTEVRGGGVGLCASCHLEGQADPGSPLAHALALGRAHRGVASEPEGLSAGALDRESRTCLSCHDGVAGPMASVRTLSTLGAADGWRSQHPVGIPYEERPAGRTALQLRPVRSGLDRIRLFEGRLGCGSCHDPYSSIEGMLIAEKRDGRLCLTCHVK